MDVTGPYEDGFCHLALEKLLYFANLNPTSVNRYHHYLRQGVDNELTPLEDIRGFVLSENYLDNAVLGHGYLALYAVRSNYAPPSYLELRLTACRYESTGRPKYVKAAQTLHENLYTRPMDLEGEKGGRSRPSLIAKNVRECFC